MQQVLRRSALEARLPTSYHQYNQRGRNQGLQKPAGSELILTRMKDDQKHAKGEVVKYPNHQAEGDHKLANSLDVPAPRIVNHLVVHPVGGRDGHFRKIRQQVDQQDLLGQQRKEREEHKAPAMLNIFPKLALVAMNTYFSVLANHGPPFPHALDQDVRSCRQIDIRRFFGASTALSTEIPTSAACSAVASLMPSPR